MRILSKEQSFALMEKKFTKLTLYDIIDLCHEEERYPAVILAIDYIKRTFTILPLKKSNVVKCLTGSMGHDILIQETKEVILPSIPTDKHSSWNVVGK